MTTKKITAPRQVELTHQLSALIDQSSFELLSNSELVHRTRVPEGDWDYRLTQFVDAPENNIPNTGIARDITRALLTTRCRDHLAHTTIAKHTKILKEDMAPPQPLIGKAKAKAFAKLRKKHSTPSRSSKHE